MVKPPDTSYDYYNNTGPNKQPPMDNITDLPLFYTGKGFPNPDVVHFYMAETSSDHLVQPVEVELYTRANRTPEMLKVNPLGEIPSLAISGGLCISESTAICQYLDDLQGGTSLLGTTPEERAETLMWLLRLENKILGPMEKAYHGKHAVEFYRNTRPGQVHPELVAPSLKQQHAGLAFLNGQLADREFVCGQRFSLADIRFYCIYNFFSSRDAEQAADPQLAHLHAYVRRLQARPAVATLQPTRNKAKL
jgi:glutathione S-transferase